ncbi:MAG TPA: serine/threonine-protein kinase, partial [Myxococcaceae bacterium]|nr:serine/threonine-protein kinase [Myxococcaceae bacterium]
MSDQERKQGETDAEAVEEAPTLVRTPAAGAAEPGEADTWLSSSGSRPIDASTLAPGCTVAGRYTVLEWLGQGGMGVVLAAYDARLDRRVALKLLRYREDEESTGGSASNSLEARLVREAQAMARLSHPHVVAVYDAGTLEDGSLFIAMEYVEGQTLRQWCAQRARPWREVLGAYLSAGRGLAAAHAAGLIHRDFKPDNVLVGQDGRVRVTDFGLARVGSDTPEQSPVPEEQSPHPLPSGPWSSGSARTVAGSLLGTPGYMALEQLQRRPADARSDLFAFCASLYEALYGHLPFSGDSLGELARAQQEERVVPPPPASEVPAWVARVVLQGLRADPSQRPASMETLLAALEDDPEAKRKARLRTAALVGGVTVLAGLAAWGLVRQQGPGCGDMESRLAGVWDAPVKERVRKALEDTGLPYARDTAERVSAVLDGYASAWVRQRTEVCEVGRGGAARPGSLALLQEYCLERRRSQLRALTELLARGPDRELVDRAVQAAQSLPPLAYCADARALTAAVPPPEEPAVRARVESLQERVDRLQALHDAGKFREGLSLGDSLRGEVEQSGYAPLQARTL